MAESAELRVPTRQYFRPDGNSMPGFLTIKDAYTAERVETLDIIRAAGIEFTLELDSLGNAIICMDDGTFDYQFEVVPQATIGTTVVRLIDNFDKEDYHQHTAAHAAAENASVPWSGEG